MPARDDFYACLGLSLAADDFQIQAAYRRTLRMLNPDRFAPGDTRALKVSKLFQQAIIPAYSCLRVPSLRREYLHTFVASSVAACREVPLLPTIARMRTATSQSQLRALYEEQIKLACEDLHLDPDRFDAQTLTLHRLNLAYVGLSRATPWKSEGERVSPTAPTAGEGEHLLREARQMLEVGQIARALQLLRSAHLPPRQMAVRHELLGHCYRLLGTSSLAVREFRTALQLDPNRTSALAALRQLGNLP